MKRFNLKINDNVTGLTLRQVEDAVRNARTLEDWRNAILGINSGVRAVDINELFNFYMALGINSCPVCSLYTF